MSGTVRTTCPYCGVGCGLLARRLAGDGEASVEIAADPAHPSNVGRLCSKGAALAETLGPSGRLLYPHVNGQRVSWESALAHVAQGFARVIREYGPESVAFYVSGQLLTEDYYVANKLMKGFIGAANIDTNSRLCMASAVVGHKRAFGEDLVPGCYEDLELADLIVLVGSNTAWCHPVIYQRIAAAREQRSELKIVVIDPRRTPTCELADLHLPIRAGSDVMLFNGLLAFLHREGCSDADFIRAHTVDAQAALDVAWRSAGDLATVSAACGVDENRIAEFYRLFTAHERVVTAFSQGVNQSSSGTDKVNSIINCHLLTGRIGKPGACPFSITGQPNAMGGREVGGMANTLAAHMEIENAAHRQIVQDFWRSPRIAAKPGLKAVEMFGAMHAGRIKAVWIMATNPVVSLPDADRVREALQRCELVVVSECMARTDTSVYAHVLLPATTWGEKDGTVTNSERRISRQRAFVAPPGEARHDWWIVCEVAKRMGFADAFGYDSPHEIFDEHARLSGAANQGTRALDISDLAGLSKDDYDVLAPKQWPRGAARLFTDGHFYHPDGKARFVPTPPRAPAHATNNEFPLVLNTGRIRDQWHTMTRTGRSPRLAEHLPEPFADMHAQDALLAGLRVGELVRLITKWGSMIVRLRTSGEVPRGTVFAPIHWNSCTASDARTGALVNPVVDALSGEPEFKHTPVRIEPFPVEWYGFLMSREPLPNVDTTWWTLVRGAQQVRYELAGREVHKDFAAWARRLLNATDPDADYIDYEDAATGTYRAAYLIDDRLVACLCISRRAELPSRSAFASLFDIPRLENAQRSLLLAGQVRNASADCGPTVCSCFRVGRKTLVEAITTHRLSSPAAVGARLKAGTNCGSCLPEIRALLQAGVES
jgi:assimilatory nitrate reductase catalytic subunit